MHHNGYNDDIGDEENLTIVKRSDQLDVDVKEEGFDNENKPPSSYDYYRLHQQHKTAIITTGKKRGRPSGKGAAAKEWDDAEIFALIELWKDQDILFNTKHHLYYNKEERDKAVQEMKEKLERMNVFATPEQICDKMTNLKCYYGSQKRQTEYFKQQYGAESRDYVSPWKFYNKLTFLNGHFLQRSSNPRRKQDSFSNGGDPQQHTKPTAGRKLSRNNNEQCITYDTYGSKMSVLDPYHSNNNNSKSMIDPYQNKSNIEGFHFSSPSSQQQQQQQQTKIFVTEPYSNSIEAERYWGEPTVFTSVSSHSTNGESPQQPQYSPLPPPSTDKKKSEDECFCELMLKMLSQIPDTEEKAVLKLEMQQKVVSLRYSEGR